LVAELFGHEFEVVKVGGMGGEGWEAGEEGGREGMV
jgi:hypothetical protein